MTTCSPVKGSHRFLEVFARGALSLVLVITVALKARAQDFNYVTNNGTIVITQYIGPGGNVIIPDTITGLPVTGIGAFSFNDFSSSLMTNVTISGSVTNIGQQAFASCPILMAFNIDTNNTAYSSLDGVLFDKGQTELIQFPYGNDRTSYSIPNGVTNIETFAFYTCARLITVTVPGSVTDIGDGAFEKCGLTSIAIPDSVLRLGNFAFRECNGLTNVTLGNSVTNVPDFEFYSCANLTSVTMSNSVIRIGDQSFSYCKSLANIIIPNSVSTLGYAAFAWCPSLLNIELPNSVTSIGDDIFESCSSLTNVTLSDSMTNISGLAFSGCALKSIVLPSSVSSIGGQAFNGCPLTGAYFEGNAPTFGQNVFFADNNVTAYYLPGSVGWGTTTTTFADGRPTAFWRPQIQGNRALGGEPDQFGFTVNWAKGKAVAVDATTDLGNAVWAPLQTNTLSTGSFYFTDPEWTNYSTRLYRIRSP